MKKLWSVVLIACMAAGLAACGGKEQSVTYTSEMENSGVTIKDTMTLNAKGDEVHEIVEKLEVDMTAVSAADSDAMAAIYDGVVESYQSIEGVTASKSYSGQVYTIDITIDAAGDAVGELVELGLMSIEGSSEGISLKASGAAMEAGGYTKVEQEKPE